MMHPRRFRSSLFSACLALSSLTLGCPSTNPAPIAPTANAVAKGPFGRLTLPANTRAIWIVYRETWRVATDAEAGDFEDPTSPTDGMKKSPRPPTLRRRDLMTIEVLRPDAQGHVVPPTSTPLGSQKHGAGWELYRVHAIVVAPGRSIIDWDSHAFESTPTPAETPPVVPESLHAVEDGCEAVEGLAAFFRDFPQGIRTGLPARTFTHVAYPVVGAMLSTLIAHLPGPGNDDAYDAEPDDADADGSSPKKQKTCQGYGETTVAFRGQLQALRAWVGSQPQDDEDVDVPDVTPDAPPKAPLPPESSMPLVGVDHDARWTAVVQLWGQGDGGSSSIRRGLASNDGDERLAALIAAWGATSATPVIPDLLRVLRNKDTSEKAVRERAFALAALRHAGTPDASAVPAIVELIASDGASEDDVTWARTTLAAMAANARSAARPLVEIIRSTKDTAKKARAIEALQAIGANAGDVLSELVELLRSPDSVTADGALSVLRLLGEGAKPVLPALITATKDAVPATRERACLAIAAIGKTATDAIDPLKERLTDTDASVRRAALLAYAAFGPASAPMLDAIRTAMFDADSSVRTQAARTLGAMGPAAAKAAPFLGDVLGDPIASVQEAAATTLTGLGTAAKPALPKLVTLLQSTQNDSVRHAAANAIVEIGPDAAPEIPKVVAALEKSGAWYLPQVIERMGKTMKRAAATHLGALLDGKPEQIERAAIVAIGNLGKDGTSEVPRLVKLIEKPGLSSYVFSALGTMGEGASSSIDKVIDVLVRRNDLRGLCSTTLPKLGPKVVAPLTKLMTDPKKDSALRMSIVRTLFDVGPKASSSTLAILETLDAVAPSDTYTVAGFRRIGRDATGKLVSATRDKRPGIQRKAILALGYLPAEAAKEAIPALLTLASEKPELEGDALLAITRYGKAVAKPIVDAILADEGKKKLHDVARKASARLG